MNKSTILTAILAVEKRLIAGEDPMDKKSDDAKYVALMDKYKLNRRSDPQGAMKYLDAALALADRGNVSEDAIAGGAYL